MSEVTEAQPPTEARLTTEGEPATGAKPATLKIRFRCMCFFVPDERDPTARRMHVVMPDTNGGCHPPAGAANGNGTIDPHVVRLVFPSAGGRLVEEAGDPANGKKGGMVEVDKGKGDLDFRKMEGWALQLTGIGSGELDTSLRPEVVNLSEVNGLVDPALFAPAGHPCVISRIELDAGQIDPDEGIEAPATWGFLGQDRKLAQEVVWSIPLKTPTLRWRRTWLKPDQAPADDEGLELPELTPDEDGEIQIFVYHVTAPDFPKPLDGPDDFNTRASHFAAFYRLFESPVNTSIPVFRKIQQGQFATCITGSGRTG